MPAIIYPRDNKNQPTPKPQDTLNVNTGNYTRNLIITLIILFIFALVLGVSLYVIRRQRNHSREIGVLRDGSRRSRKRSRLTISTNHRSSSSYGYSEKQNLITSSSQIAFSPDSVPEIRITFPEEEDKDGRRVSGRVVVVKVGEAGVGFVRPLDHDQLPPYQKDSSTERFDSVDIERIGGLKDLK